MKALEFCPRGYQAKSQFDKHSIDLAGDLASCLRNLTKKSMISVARRNRYIYVLCITVR